MSNTPAPRAKVRGMGGSALPLVLQRRPHAICDHGWIFVEGKDRGALKSLRPRNEDAEAAVERVGGDPRFVASAGASAASLERRL